MSEQYKMVPVEPTREMERAAESYWNERRFKGLSDDPRTWAGVYQVMLADAPDVTALVTALVDALEQIERWDGFPSTNETWEGSGKPVSYSAAFGSNGERDFMRGVAKAALAAYRE